MGVSAEAIKQLREKSGAGVMDCKKALEKCSGDVESANKLLREQGLAVAAKRSSRVASQGLIEVYVHAGGRIGAMVEVNCESDFVARTEGFKQLAHELAMQVAAINPQYVGAEDVPAGEKVNPAEVCLLQQPYIRDPQKTIQDLIVETVARTGENIRVRRFARFELGN
ncbi:MAG: translation elongation factor Ts [Dehalococcoidia bacterium]|nr:translation elongation factor Ts [Dehalococcoidia bacterium]